MALAAPAPHSAFVVTANLVNHISRCFFVGAPLKDQRQLICACYNSVNNISNMRFASIVHHMDISII